MNIFDFLIMLLLAFGAYKGFKRGFIRSFGGLLGLVASLMVAVKFNQIFAAYLDKQFEITNKLGGWLAKVLPLPSIAPESDTISAGLAVVMIEEMSLPDFMKKSLANNVEQIIQDGLIGIGNLPELISIGLAGMLLKGFAFILLFFATGAIVKLAVNLISSFLGYTPLGPVNSVAGMGLGVILYGIFFAVVLSVFSPLIVVSASQGGSTAGIIHSSYFFSQFLDLFDILSGYILGFIIK